MPGTLPGEAIQVPTGRVAAPGGLRGNSPPGYFLIRKNLTDRHLFLIP